MRPILQDLYPLQQPTEANVSFAGTVTLFMVVMNSIVIL